MESRFICVPSLDLVKGGCVMEKALILDRSEWVRIRDHMKYLQNDGEYAEQQHKIREKIKEKSRIMTKDWNNTLQNKRERRLAANKAKVEAIEKRRNETQQIFRKEQVEEKKKYLEECQKALYYSKDNVKMLNKRLLFSEVLRMREEQIKFDKRSKEIYYKREQAYAEKCKKDLKEFKKEQQLLMQKRIEKQKKHQEDLLAQIKAKEEAKLEEENEKMRERDDLEAIKKELDIAEKCEKKQKEISKRNYMKEIEENFAKDKRYQDAKKHEEEMADKLIDIYANSKRRLVKMQNTREKQLKEATLLRRDKMCNYIAEIIKEKENDEDARIGKSIAETEITLEKQRLKKLEHEKHLVKEKIQAYNEFLEQEMKRKKEEEDVKNWEMMQRFKQNENNRQFYKQREEKRSREIAELRKCYDDQIKERDEVLEKEKEAAVEAMKYEKVLYGTEDDAFLSYAKELMEDCRHKGRNLMPILRSVEDYKKKNGLIQETRIPPALKTNITFDPLPEPAQSWRTCQPKSETPCSTKK